MHEGQVCRIKATRDIFQLHPISHCIGPSGQHIAEIRATRAKRVGIDGGDGHDNARAECSRRDLAAGASEKRERLYI